MAAVSDEILRKSSQGRHRLGDRAEEPSPEGWRGLFTALAAGDRKALESIYRVAARKIFGLALWRTGSVEDAGDVVQEVFLRLAQKHHRLGRVRDPRGWLLGLAHHVAVDVARRRTRRSTEPLDDVPFLKAPEVDGARAIDAERASALLAKLPPAQRDVIYLRHFADCTFALIGDITGVPTFTAASRYRLGIERLRRLMEKTQ